MSLLGRKMDKISIDNYPSQPIGSETLINIHIQIMLQLMISGTVWQVGEYRNEPTV